MYKCKFFKITELVHPSILSKYGEDKCWTFFDDRLLKFIDWLREKYGSIVINSSSAKNCGARPMESTVGAGMSAHKLFRGFDCHIMSIEKKYLKKADKAKAYSSVRKEIMKEKEWDFLNFEITSSNEPITWLHVDTYNRKNREFNA